MANPSWSGRGLLLAGAVLAAQQFAGMAAVPPAQRLLPQDTLFVLTVPDWQKASEFYRTSSQAKLWHDPTLKPFRDNFVAQLKKQVVEPVEKELEIKLADYVGLVQGQLTFAITQGGWGQEGEKLPDFVLLFDAGDKRDEVLKRLADLEQKFADSGDALQQQVIRGVEFTTLKQKPDQQENGDFDLELTFGLSETLFIASSDPSTIEKVLVQQSGGAVPALADDALFQSDYTRMFRESLGYGWVNFKPLYKTIVQQLEASIDEEAEQEGPRPSKILEAVGIESVTSLAMQFRGQTDGAIFEVSVGAPEAERRGLLRILVPESKDAAPPAFVPSDVVKFSRWRHDGKKAWATVEEMIAGISPELGGMLQFMLSQVGKEKDPNFDLKQNLIGNLGDDFISFEKQVDDFSLQGISQGKGLFLIGSPNPDQLAGAFRVIAGSGMLPVMAPGGVVNEREFLGRTVYSIPLMSVPAPGQDEAAAERTLHFAASGAYVGFSSDAATLEGYLRNSGEAEKPLRELPVVRQAAEKVGGMATGFFGYEDQKETMRAVFEMVRKDGDALQAQLGAMFDLIGEDGENPLKQWVDPSLLPEFSKIEKYFSIVVYSGQAHADGLSWKFYAPEPRLAE